MTKVYAVYSTHSQFPPTDEPTLWGTYTYRGMAEMVAAEHADEFPGSRVYVREV